MASLPRLLVSLAFGCAVCACAAVSGLDQYSSGSDSSVASDQTGPSHPPDASGDVRGDTTSPDVVVVGEGDGTFGTDSGDESVGTGEASLDTGSDDSGDAGNQNDGGDGGDSEAGDGGPDADGGHPACGPGPGNCGGCCDNTGTCVGGMSNTTCGTGGAACVNCGSQSCNNGACSTVVSDAGRCTAMSCNAFTRLCIPVYQLQCCKSDGTCGCAIEIPTMGTCL
jgi:hypothetical protein